MALDPEDQRGMMGVQDKVLEVDDRWVALTIGGTIVFFALLNQALLQLAASLGERCLSLGRMREWPLRNMTVSLIHACFCSAGCFYFFYFHGQELETLADLMGDRPEAGYFVVAFSTGYFLFDLLEFIAQGKAFSMYEVTLHHIGVLVVFLYNLYYHLYVPFAILALLVEVNSIFLHTRKLMQKLGVPFSHWAYRCIVVINLVTFVGFRGFSLTTIWVGFLSNLHMCSTVYKVYLGTIMVFMVVLNFGFFLRLVKSDMLRTLRPGRRKEKEERGGADDKGDKQRQWSEQQNGKTRVIGSAPESGLNGPVRMNGADPRGVCPSFPLKEKSKSS